MVSSRWIFSLIMLEMEPTSPIGEPNKVALIGSTMRAPGRADRIAGSCHPKKGRMVKSMPSEQMGNALEPSPAQPPASCLSALS